MLMRSFCRYLEYNISFLQKVMGIESCRTVMGRENSYGKRASGT